MNFFSFFPPFLSGLLYTHEIYSPCQLSQQHPTSTIEQVGPSHDTSQWWKRQAGEAQTQRSDAGQMGIGKEAELLFFFPAKHQQDTEQEVQEVKRKLTASNLTTVSIFLTALSVSTLTMMSPAGREKVREEMLGEERGFVPPLERTM